MRNITVACFSPSGGTRRAAERLAGTLGETQMWLDLIDPGQRTAELGEGDVLLLALPVYAGRVPAVEGLLDGLTGQNTPCVLLAAYGNRHYDDALAQMQKKMEERGFRCVGVAAVITPHVFAPELGAGRPDERDMALLTDFAGQICAKLEQDAWDDVYVPGAADPEPKKAVPVPKERDMERCVRCGLCVHHCHLDEGQVGMCRARACRDGTIVSLSYGRLTALALDPIEKKPLRRFHPGSAASRRKPSGLSGTQVARQCHMRMCMEGRQPPRWYGGRFPRPSECRRQRLLDWPGDLSGARPRAERRS